jgi:NAD(P)-dependent dehydrogenase (short-subunit alcohol dehydrogenase family)
MVNAMKRFDGKVVLITGAASGIGRASAIRIGAEGGQVACTDVVAAAVEETAATIRDAGGEAFAMVCDVSKPDDVQRAVAATVERYGKLDSLCNIAGILRFDNTHELALADWQRILAVNLTGTFLMCQAALPHLLAVKGNIVNMSSTAALAGHPWAAAYAASKGGVLAFTHTLAVEYGKQGLRVNALCPGAVSTPIQDQFRFPEGADRKLLYRIMPLHTFGAPETAAAAVAFLASEDAAHINGTALRVDGGTLA